MSYSVSNLFKVLAENPKQAEGKLYNPDIPDSNFQARDRQFIKDQAHNSLRLTSQPRNGDGYLLPRNVFDLDPRKDSFLMERSIDPDVIRQKVNPISEANPQAVEGALYGIDSTMKTSTDSVNLIRTSQEQFYNYSNRFSMMPETPLPQPTAPIDISQMIKAPTKTTPTSNKVDNYIPKVIQTLPPKGQPKLPITGRVDDSLGSPYQKPVIPKDIQTLPTKTPSTGRISDGGGGI
jgi:hypothetical protein